MTVGYLRISTEKQNLENQKNEIDRYAQEHSMTIDLWVTEVVSGKKSENTRKLGALLRKMKKGDTLIITEISRLSRTLTDIMEIMGRCLKKGIKLYTTKEGYTFDDTINSKVLCFAFALVAELERNLISMRTKEALANKRSNGVTLGRPKGTSPKRNNLAGNKQLIIKLINNNISVCEICRRLKTSTDTFRRFAQNNRDISEALKRRQEGL